MRKQQYQSSNSISNTGMLFSPFLRKHLQLCARQPNHKVNMRGKGHVIGEETEPLLSGQNPANLNINVLINILTFLSFKDYFNTQCWVIALQLGSVHKVKRYILFLYKDGVMFYNEQMAEHSESCFTAKILFEVQKKQVSPKKATRSVTQRSEPLEQGITSWSMWHVLQECSSSLVRQM